MDKATVLWFSAVHILRLPAIRNWLPWGALSPFHIDYNSCDGGTFSSVQPYAPFLNRS
jgi:hypothetical protein